ncbi:hypothetical protein SALBM217S_06385 [Streptomyces griseoloalbus]
MASVHASAAALPAAYAALPAVGFVAPAALIRTYRPRSLRWSASWKASVVCCTVRTSSSSRKSQSSRLVLVNVSLPRQPPTRWTRPSTRPNSFSVRAAQSRVDSRSSRSTVSPVTVAPPCA